MVAGAMALGSFGAVGCGSSGGGGGDGTMVADGDFYHFAQDKLTIPATPAESMADGLNIDEDPMNRPDNRLGNVLATLAGQGIMLQASVDKSVTGGQVVLLHSIRTNDATLTTDATVSWQVFLGDKFTAPAVPDFTGAGTFSVASTSPTDGILTGTLVGGKFTGGPATVQLQIALVAGAAPLAVNLIGSRIEAMLTPTSCSGKLGGAITQTDLDTQVLPAVANLMNTSIMNDPGCQMTPRMCGASAQQILDLFDKNMDGMITLDEVKGNDLIKSLLSADVDLLDSNNGNKFDPRKDGMADSLSLGVGFHCVPGKFTAASETGGMVHP